MIGEECVRAVWDSELDRLELDVIRVERLLQRLETVPLEPWRPPLVRAPMPADLEARARELLDRQQRAAVALRTALGEAQRQLAYADHVSDVVSADAPRPVFVDVDA